MSIDFVAFDIETANQDRGSICAIGWAVVRDGAIAAADSTLCRPPDPVDWFSGWNMAIHGIRPEDVADQPTFAELVPELIETFGELPVVAHNAAFDMGALRSALAYAEIPWPSLHYGCTLVWSRRLLDLPSHRLPIVCEHLGLDLRRHHDACQDAVAAAAITLKLANRVGASSLQGLLDTTRSNFGRLQPDSWIGCAVRSTGSSALPVPVANLDADPENPLYGQTVVFTGGLSSMTREVAWDYVANAGGTIGKGTNKRTTILVLGNGFVGNTLDDFLTTRKAQRALECRTQGQRIEFWSEEDFLKALATSGVATLTSTSDTPAPPVKLSKRPTPRTLFAIPSPESWQDPHSYPHISEPYWRWWEASLSGGSRATGGETCRICNGTIDKTAAWKLRDRHVCGSECNTTLKRRFKATLARGDIPNYSPPPPDPYDAAERNRPPRLFRTDLAAEYPFEHGRFPIVGDRLERHGVYTEYLPLHAAADWIWPEYLRSVLAAVESATAMVIREPSSGAWTLFFTGEDSQPVAFSPGAVSLDGRAYAIHYGEQRPTLPNGLYYNRELISDVDDRGREYRWEAASFSFGPVITGWTPARQRLSDKRRLASNGRRQATKNP